VPSSINTNRKSTTRFVVRQRAAQRYCTYFDHHPYTVRRIWRVVDLCLVSFTCFTRQRIQFTVLSQSATQDQLMRSCASRSIQHQFIQFIQYKQYKKLSYCRDSAHRRSSSSRRSRSFKVTDTGSV